MDSPSSDVTSESCYWQYYPKALDNDTFFLPLLQELTAKCDSYVAMTKKDQQFLAKRVSCVFSDVPATTVADAATPYFSYNSLPTYTWNSSSLISQIRQFLQQNFKVEFTHCLAHIYRDGKDALGWHSDKEALDNAVVSVSFGHSRKFRLRPMNATSGWTAEYELGSGDILAMLPGCQRKFKHCVAAQATVTEPRINLTFRYQS